MLGTFEVAKLTGVTPRQLQWWDERKVVTPQMYLHAKAYTLNEAFCVAVIADLRSKGFSLQRIRRFLTVIVRRVEQWTLGGRMTPLYLLTDGRKLWFEEDDSAVVHTLHSATKPLSMVYVSYYYWKIQAHAENIEARRQKAGAA